MSKRKWVSSTLDNVADLIMGQSPNSSYYNEEGKGTPFLQGCAQFGKHHPDTKIFCTQPTKIAPQHSILFSVRAPVGDINYADKAYCIGRGLAAINAKNKIHHGYLMNFLMYVSGSFERVAQGSTFSAINSTELGNLEICYPALTIHQSKIAEILSTLDRAIEQTEALIAKYQRVKTGLMQDLLTRGIDENGNLRDPSTHKFKDSPLGKIPEEWNASSINDISIYVGSGITPTGGSNVYSDFGVVFLRSQNVYQSGLVLEDVAFISDSIDMRMKRSRVFENDVLLNITGASIGRCCYYPTGSGRANVNQHVCIIRQPKASREDAIFLSVYISSEFGQNQIKRLNAGGNREGLNYEQVKAMSLPYPPPQERTRIAGKMLLSKAFANSLENELLKLQLLKSGLMQDLLTGNVSVEPLLTPDE